MCKKRLHFAIPKVIATEKICSWRERGFGVRDSGEWRRRWYLSTKRGSRSCCDEMRWLVISPRKKHDCLSRPHFSLLPLFHFDSSIHHRGIHVVLLELYFPTNRVILIPPLLPAERVVRQQNLDPKYRAIPMPCRQSLTDDGKIVGDFHRRYVLKINCQV
ncbi:hypothetical protein BC938DRAFT_483596 [Jimgerdemannia flammicorona]|uniref:Uncharacterized protein n=1 Tax=Jimgerdemannia flammicorona TaxID=994334 RepID=A0A433QBT6_9FUNG|nr:hypothetical protein BC938DRAFT_483596 [Jimgerdemannia flammicorona]